ncbi:IS110 family transposase [Proteinivorax tanatarense]|uniref:IS110 family transposase n=1 Tax=Proteinivorax tanatarense TaxID=1260629 RepID=A0AAU7VJJ2_9FIRM
MSVTLTGMMPSLWEVALLVDVTLDYNFNWVQIKNRRENDARSADDSWCGRRLLQSSCSHRLAGDIVTDFEIPHSQKGFKYFFNQITSFVQAYEVSDIVVGMEGTNGHARPLDQMVKDKGYILLNVNNLKFARFKEIFATPGKNDRMDARQIVTLMMMAPMMEQGKEVLQEVHNISEIETKLKRISRRRQQIVQEKVIVQNRMQADLQSICPGFLSMFAQVDSLYVLRFLSCRSDIRKLKRLRLSTIRKIPGIGKGHAKKLQRWQQEASFGSEVEWVGPMISEDAARLLSLKEKLAELEKQIEILVKQSRLASLLLSIPGFGTICAGTIAAEIGTINRFDSEAGLAIYLGMAPLDNSSGLYEGTKSPKQVNKHAKRAMMTALGHHIRKVAESKTYYEKKRDEGKKYNQALRSLGRHLTRVIWSMIKHNRNYQTRKEEPTRVA